MKKIAFFLVFLLVACTQEAVVQDSLPEQVVQVQDVVPPVEKQETACEPAVSTVKRVCSSGDSSFGLSSDSRVVRIDSGSPWEFFFSDGLLTKVSGSDTIELEYSNGLLVKAGNAVFERNGDNIVVIDGEDRWHFDFYGGQLASVKRGVSGGVDFVYSDGRISSFSRGSVVTSVVYDDKFRVRNIDSDEAKLIIGYWRDNKVSSLTGKSFGQGLTVSYGPDHPPLQAKIVHFEDDSVFTAANSDELYEVVDRYVYCNYIKRLDLFFDPVSYVFFVNYFKGGLQDYFVMNFACRAYEI